MRRICSSPLLLATLLVSGRSPAANLRVECLGTSAKDAKGYLVYLHGFENANGRSAEEVENRAQLAQLASELKLRIALPEGPVCPKERRCWPAKSEEEVLATFADIQKAKDQCFPGKEYTLVGFSNGGYYAFKLYKVHKDKALTSIIASSSSGIFDPERDKANPLSRFSLMIGDRDITRRDAEAFVAKLQKSAPGVRFRIFPGGHRMDYKTLRSWLAP